MYWDVEDAEEGIFGLLESRLHGNTATSASASTTKPRTKTKHTVTDKNVNVNVQEDTDYTACPYVEGHTIPSHQRHSEDHYFKYGCLEGNPEITNQYRRCIFDFSHHVPVGDMEKHLTTCQAYWKYVIHENDDPMDRVPGFGMDPRPTSVHIQGLMPAEVPANQNQRSNNLGVTDAVRKYFWTEVKCYVACFAGLALLNFWLKRGKKLIRSV